MEALLQFVRGDYHFTSLFHAFIARFDQSRAIRQFLAPPPDDLKGAVYIVWIFVCICMSLRVFLFAKKMKFLTKGGIHCISQVFPWHFYFMREHSLVELTEHDDSAAFIVPIHISVYR